MNQSLKHIGAATIIAASSGAVFLKIDRRELLSSVTEKYNNHTAQAKKLDVAPVSCSQKILFDTLTSVSGRTPGLTFHTQSSQKDASAAVRKNT